MHDARTPKQTVLRPTLQYATPCLMSNTSATRTIRAYNDERNDLLALSSGGPAWPALFRVARLACTVKTAKS